MALLSLRMSFVSRLSKADVTRELCTGRQPLLGIGVVTLALLFWRQGGKVMKKRMCNVSLSIAAVFVISACGGGSSSSDGSEPASGSSIPRLHLNGSNIVDSTGQAVTLRGWNWGRWGFAQPS